ncbi:MAG: glycosyltransferase family 39 protein [Anaerolineae bacterium]
MAAAILGLGVIPWFAGNRYTLPGMIAWLGSLGCVAAAVWPAAGRLRWPPVPVSIKFSGPAVLVLLSIAIGAFFRLHRIHSIPLEMGCDLPLIHANIAGILRGEYPIFFESHPGREGLFFYVAAPIAAVGGLSHTSIKVTAALVGILSIPALYWLGREVFDPWTGALAAFLLAISHWHVILSRVGYRAVLMPLLVALSLIYLVRGLKTGRYIHFALGAFWVGLGLQSYNAFMVVPPMMGLALVLSRMWRKRLAITVDWRHIALWVFVVLLVALPLLCYVIEDPQRYIYRVATRATAIETPLPNNVAGTWLRNVSKAVAMFNYQGDSIYISNVPRYRQLGFVTGVFFVLGAVYCVLRRGSRFIWLVWLAFAGLMLPSTLALAFPDEVPSAVRSIGALLVVLLFPAVGVRVSGHWVREVWSTALPLGTRWTGGRLLALGVGSAVVVALAAELVAVYPLYFERYVAAQPLQNQSISLEMARTIDDFADDGRAYILSAPYWYDGNAVRAQLVRTPRDWSNELLALDPGVAPLDDVTGRVLVIVHPDARAALALLESSFADYIVLEHRWADGSIAFKAFYGER